MGRKKKTNERLPNKRAGQTRRVCAVAQPTSGPDERRRDEEALRRQAKRKRNKQRETERRKDEKTKIENSVDACIDITYAFY